MANFIAGLIVVVCIGAAVTYIIKAKKKGVKCIGCPDAGSCAHTQNSNTAEGCSCSGCNGGCH